MPLDTSLLQAALIGYQHRLAQIEAGRLRQTSEVGNAVHQSATSRHRQLAERTRIDALNDARTLKEVEDLVRELEEASELFSRRQTEYDTQPMRVFWNIAAATGAAVSTGVPAGAAVVGAGARSLPKMLQDIGPALFGRGAFDLAKRVRREVSKIDPNVLKRFLSASEQKSFGML